MRCKTRLMGSSVDPSTSLVSSPWSGNGLDWDWRLDLGLILWLVIMIRSVTGLLLA